MHVHILYFIFGDLILSYYIKGSAHIHTCICVHADVPLVQYVYKSVIIVQKRQSAKRACSLLLSPCRVCLFLSASQPPLPPPHSAWGVIKSVFACPQAKEIGIHTHTPQSTHAVTLTGTHLHTVTQCRPKYTDTYIYLHPPYKYLNKKAQIFILPYTRSATRPRSLRVSHSDQYSSTECAAL